MGPALTHVSMKYGDSGWKHVTAEEAEVLFTHIFFSRSGAVVAQRPDKAEATGSNPVFSILCLISSVGRAMVS